ncbi:MAG: DegT/DnrJ/EryC1/StrS family aminotransferase, partial [Gemmatimonadota bacterium]|nr:DegT/DnrJ/EryC1/StrS family aminotransferase [Gemmatimonadota bacterium]
MRSRPLPPWPHYSSEQVEAARRVLESGRVNYWTGTECRQFEEEFAAYHGGGHAISLANGTLALELALRILGVGKGD